MERNDRFLGREFNKALIPVMLSVLAGVINTFIDTLFLSRRLGGEAIAAVNLTLPVFFVVCTVGTLFSEGAFVAASHCIGKHDRAGASKYYHSALFLSVIAGFIFMLTGLFFVRPICGLLCSDPALFDMVLKYCRISMIGAIFTILSYIPSAFLLIAGRSRDISNMMWIMILTDISLDYFFLYAYDGGVTGAALASVLSMYMACTYGFSKLGEGDGIFRTRLYALRPYDVFCILSLGCSQAVGNLMDAVRMLVLNWIIYRAGGAQALAVWAVLNCLSELSLCFISGIPNTGAPVISVCHSSHDNDGIRVIIRQEATNMLATTVSFAFITLILHRVIALLFHIEGSLFIPILSLGIAVIFEGLVGMIGTYFNCTKRIFLANVIMIMRACIFQILFAFAFLQTGVVIWYFMPAGMALALAFTVLLARLISAKSKGSGHELSGLLLLDDYLTKNNKVRSMSIISSAEGICGASEEIMDFCRNNEMERKLVNKMGLAFEEVMTVMAEKSLGSDKDPLDVRIYSTEEKLGISIMCAGKPFNPFYVAEQDEDDLSIMGVSMINKMARDCRYIYALGINILEVDF